MERLRTRTEGVSMLAPESGETSEAMSRISSIISLTLPETVIIPTGRAIFPPLMR